MESFEEFGLKFSIYSCLNEYMKIYEYKRSWSFFARLFLKKTLWYCHSPGIVGRGGMIGGGVRKL